MTIRLRLTLLFAVLLGAIGIVRVSAVLASFSNSQWVSTQQDVTRRAHLVTAYLGERQSDFTPGYLAELAPLDAPAALPQAFSDDGMYVQLTGVDGRVLNKSANLGRHVLPPPKAPGIQVIDIDRPRLFDSSKVAMVAERYELPGRGLVAWVQVGLPLADDHETFRQLAAVEIGGWLFALLLALGVGYMFAGRVLAPIAAMTEEARAFRSTELHRRLNVPDPPRDELERLGATFNDLFERLERSFEAQRRFVGDASHELRSPLTVIRGHLQLIQRRGADNPEEAKAWLATAIKEVDRLTRLVNDMLQLARGEAEGRSTRRLPLDLCALAGEVCQQLAIATPRIAWEPCPAPVWVTGDPDALRQILLNLLDNAERATREHGAVTVSVRPAGERAELVVADTGLGMPEETLDRIFDRFYRVDHARGRASGGTGLGLAITQELVAAHDGEIAVESRLGAGSTFTVSLPLVPAPA